MTEAVARAIVHGVIYLPDDAFFASYEQAEDITRRVCAQAKIRVPMFPPLTVRALITYVKDHAA